MYRSSFLKSVSKTNRQLASNQTSSNYAKDHGTIGLKGFNIYGLYFETTLAVQLESNFLKYVSFFTTTCYNLNFKINGD
jgi:hypothetical protein